MIVKLVFFGIGIAVLAPSSHADPGKRTYTAFDLAGDLVLQNLEPISKISGAAVFQGGSHLPCAAKRSATQLVVAHDKNCPLFTQADPASFTVTPSLGAVVSCGPADQGRPDCVGSIAFAYAGGTDVSGGFDGSVLAIPNEWRVSADTDACVASLGDDGWKQTDVSFKHGARLESQSTLPKLPSRGVVVVRSGRCNSPATGPSLLRVTYTLANQTSPTFSDPKFCDSHTCSAPYPNAGVSWVLYVDQANALGVPRISYNPNNYIKANSFGRVRVRHWKNVAPTLSTTGTGAALTVPTEGGGSMVEKATPNIGASLLGDDGDALVSEFVVVPRAPGALNVAIKFNDVADASKSRGEIGAEILVDKAFSGAFRFGVARVFDLDDVRYVGVQNEDEEPFIIKKNTATPHEVVIGISLYSQWLARQGGRTYFLTPTYDHWYSAVPRWLWHHAGLYVGLGALSYVPNNPELLKSVHLGVELELTQNLSLALTAVVRRTPVLGDGLYVGDEIPSASANTSDTYRVGYGLVLNFSTDFLRVAAKGGQ